MTAAALPHHEPLAIRAASGADREVLARATLENLTWSGPRFTADDVHDRPEFRHYYDPWPGSEADFGLIAQDAAARAIGAVWLTHFKASDPGYGFVSEDIPELSIWVDAGHRGRGIGGSLLEGAIREARARGRSAISLSVEDGNPAVRLYERHGFAPTGTVAGCMALRL